MRISSLHSLGILSWLLAACSGAEHTAISTPVAPSPEIPAAPQPEPRECADEREHALAYGVGYSWGPPVLIDEWDGTPFRFYFDAGIPDSERQDAEHYLDVARRLADHVEDQIGYRLFDVGGWVAEEDRGFEVRNGRVENCIGIRPGGMVASVMPADGHGGANSACAVFHWSNGDIDLAFDGTLAHEMWHLFGFAHHPDSTHPQKLPPGEGVPMSIQLTNEPAGPRHLGITFEDVDALRCIFPAKGD